jgi:AcrR family transcriptional regulator
MPNQPPISSKQTKGQQTALRILDAAEDLFSARGYEGTTLREIAAKAQIQEPGLYNHFSGKHALYEAVLHRALNPMAEALGAHLGQASGLRDYTDLPSIMTDLLLDHPQISALFQQAMQGESDSLGNQLVRNWLERLFKDGIMSLSASGSLGEGEQDPSALAISVIAMFNLTTGYFLSQRAFETMAEGDLQAPENIARQKRLLHRVMRAMLIS